MNIPASVKKFCKPANLISRGTGLAALGMIFYDANHVGKVQSDLYSSEKDASAAVYYLNNTLYSNDMSKVKDKLKTTAFNIELSQTWRRFFNEGIGYEQGFNAMLIHNVIPLILGSLALFGKNITSKVSAGALAVYGMYEIAKNLWGQGVANGLGTDD